MKSTWYKLMLSLVTLLMCFAMLIGSTYAWFTDVATSSINKIQSGTLDIQIVDANEINTTLETLEWIAADNRENDRIIWEPGATYNLKSFKLKNNGDLALKCRITLKIYNETSPHGGKLSDKLKWKINDGSGDVVLTPGIPSQEYKISSEQPLSNIFTISATMPQDTDNRYQGASIDQLSIVVEATQDTVENDSFNNQYDAPAQTPVNVNETNVQSVLMTSGSSDAGNVSIVADSNITLNLSQFENAYYSATLGGKDSEYVMIDGNNKKITLQSDYRNAINCYGKLTINDAELDSTYKPEGSTWDDYAIIFRYQENGKNEVIFNNVIFDRQVAIEKGVKATFNNCTINQTSATDDMYALWIQAGADVTLNNCTINSVNLNSGNNNRAIKIADEYVWNGQGGNLPEDQVSVTNLAVNGTTFKSQKKAAVLVTSAAGAHITWGVDNDISEVAADNVNAVWNDSERAAYMDLVNVTGCTKIQEN